MSPEFSYRKRLCANTSSTAAAAVEYRARFLKQHSSQQTMWSNRWLRRGKSTVKRSREDGRLLEWIRLASAFGALDMDGTTEQKENREHNGPE